MNGRTKVAVTCPHCAVRRYEDAGQVRYRVARDQFSGYCYKDRLVGLRRKASGPRLEHPAVDWSDMQLLRPASRDVRVSHVKVTCPGCSAERYCLAGPTEARIRQGKFSGTCLECSGNARRREWIELSPGRKLDPVKGYVRVSLSGVPPEHQHLWHAMKGSTTFVFEHRLVMAMALGRPLTSRELVDHMDGVKTNNDPFNLRLYRRGKNEPGETSGYGTFYHEYQMALAKIRVLEAELEDLRTSN